MWTGKERLKPIRLCHALHALLGVVAEHRGAVLPRHHRQSAATGFTSVPELVAAIDAHVARQNTQPKPFVWTESAAGILQKVIRANARLSSKQNATLH